MHFINFSAIFLFCTLFLCFNLFPKTENKRNLQAVPNDEPPPFFIIPDTPFEMYSKVYLTLINYLNGIDFDTLFRAFGLGLTANQSAAVIEMQKISSYYQMLLKQEQNISFYDIELSQEESEQIISLEQQASGFAYKLVTKTGNTLSNMSVINFNNQSQTYLQAVNLFNLPNVDPMTEASFLDIYSRIKLFINSMEDKFNTFKKEVSSPFTKDDESRLINLYRALRETKIYIENLIVKRRWKDNFSSFAKNNLMKIEYEVIKMRCDLMIKVREFIHPDTSQPYSFYETMLFEIM